MIQTGFQFTGRQGAEQGAAQALAHAEQVNPSWGEQAYGFLISFAKRGSKFRTEEVRAYAEQQGLPNPPSARAWGGIVTRAIHAEKIERVGFSACDNPKAHSCNVSIWRGI